ncbi:MAG: pullulanase [Succinivibrio sp.]|nr:pullulanase [Succinivibrio sp.]
MKFSKIIVSAIALSGFLSACSSKIPEQVAELLPNGYSIDGKAIYLRGEMNDYEVSETYRLRKADEGYCTLATLRADWAPYKFKFADENWSNGTNFGYLNPPGVLKEGSRTIPLNPNSKFEEISFYPKADGVYKFCLIPQNDNYYLLVLKSSKKELPTMAQLIKMSKSN